MQKKKTPTHVVADVPHPLPTSVGILYAPCSGIWDGNEKGWTLVQSHKKKSKKFKKDYD